MGGVGPVHSHRKPAHPGANPDPDANAHFDHYPGPVTHADGIAHPATLQHAHHHPHAQAVGYCDGHLHAGAHLDAFSNPAHQHPRAFAHRDPLNQGWLIANRVTAAAAVLVHLVTTDGRAGIIQGCWNGLAFFYQIFAGGLKHRCVQAD